MKYKFIPKSQLERFGSNVYNTLVENFPRTFLVGGTVRDFLLAKKINDIDIATSAKPVEICDALKKHFINFNTGFVNMGVVVATEKHFTAAIATFRKDIKTHSRYPKISFVKTPKMDAARRDFTINSLYFSPKTGKILDFYQGLKDLKVKKIKFIGKPEKKIAEDPLRIVRALRFALQMNFKLEATTRKAIKNNFALVETLTKSKIEKEIAKLKNSSHKKIMRQTLLNPKKYLDKYF